MTIIYETDRFAFHAMRVGAAIVRKHDNASVYFQPGDNADRAIYEAESFDRIAEMYPNENQDLFNRWCGQYFA